MKIVFLQQLWYEWQAPMIFSAIAKNKGDQSVLIIEGNYRKAAKRAIIENPDLIVFAAITSGNSNYVFECAKIIKQIKNIPIVAGGVYVSINYQYIKNDFIDMLGIGEGELTFDFLLDTLKQSKSLEDVPGIIYKRRNETFINAPRYICRLDDIPIMDRELYYRYDVFKNEKIRMFYTGRGCKYNCSYCCVPLVNCFDKNISAIRKRSPEILIDEILQVKNKYGLKAAFFQDDTFTQDFVWLKTFLPDYFKFVKKPFMCMTNAKDLNEEIVNLFAKYRCISVGIGVETANQNTRNNILNRGETNEQIEYAIRLLKRENIKVTTFNIIGIPGETIEDIEKTIIFNRNNKVDSAWGVLYQPFFKPDYSMGKSSNIGNIYSKFVLSHPEKEKLEIIQKLFSYIVRYKWLSKTANYRIIKKTAFFLFALNSFYREINIWHRSVFLTLIVGIRNQFQYWKNSKL